MREGGKEGKKGGNAVENLQGPGPPAKETLTLLQLMKSHIRKSEDVMSG